MSIESTFLEKCYTNTDMKIIYPLILAMLFSLNLKQDCLAQNVKSYTINSQGYEWNYQIVSPSNYHDKNISLPLVILIHGAGGNGPVMLEKTGFDLLAEKYNFIVIAPTGLPANPKRNSNFLFNPRLWNSGVIGNKVQRSNINDLAFFEELIARVESQYQIDRKRVFVIGHSNGGSMAFKLASLLPEKITAIAVVESQNPVYSSQAIQRFVPTLYILGLDDPLIPIQGGMRAAKGVAWSKSVVPSTENAINRWSNSLNCKKEISEENSTDNFRTFTYCKNSASEKFQVYQIKNHGHEWPGAKERFLPEKVSGLLNKNFEASETIWEFLINSKPLSE